MQTESISIENEPNNAGPIRSVPALKTSDAAITQLQRGALDSVGEIALSINSVNDCGKHLLDGMRSLRTTDASEIMSACDVAKQIVQLARTKVELLKLRESLRK